MLKSPREAQAPSFPTTPPKPDAEIRQPQRVATSRYPAPKLLMGEVAAPRGKEFGKPEIGRKREALRAFMLARHLRPSAWAQAAGVTQGELLGFLTGKARAIAPASLEKLARAASCTPEDLFR
jgi:DNA-binding Xre family transcriptional regulator